MFRLHARGTSALARRSARAIASTATSSVHLVSTAMTNRHIPAVYFSTQPSLSLRDAIDRNRDVFPFGLELVTRSIGGGGASGGLFVRSILDKRCAVTASADTLWSSQQSLDALDAQLATPVPAPGSVAGACDENAAVTAAPDSVQEIVDTDLRVREMLAWIASEGVVQAAGLRVALFGDNEADIMKVRLVRYQT